MGVGLFLKGNCTLSTVSPRKTGTDHVFSDNTSTGVYWFSRESSGRHLKHTGRNFLCITALQADLKAA